MSRQRLAACLLVPAALAAEPSTEEWLSGSELERHCRSFLDGGESREGAACVAFVQGVIAGRSAGKPPARVSSVSDSSEDGLARRAAQTRIGSRLRSLRTERARYCLDADITPAAVIEKVAAYLAEHGPRDDAPAGHLIHRALVAEFPCEDG